MRIFDGFFKPNIGKLKENQDVDGLIAALDHQDRGIRVDAVAALREINTHQAIEALKDHKANELKKAQMLTQEGINLAQQMEFKDALRCFNRALEHNRQSAEIWYWKSMMLNVENGSSEAVLKAVNKALQLDPNYIDALKHKIRLLPNTPEGLSEALDCYDRVLSHAPYDSDAWRNKATLLSHMQRYDEALLCIWKAIDLAPLDEMVLWSASEVLENTGRMSEAISAYKQFVELATEQSDMPVDTHIGENRIMMLRSMISFALGKISEYESEVN